VSRESERIRSFYESRDADSDDSWSERWSPRNLLAVYYRHHVERALIGALNTTGIDLRGLEILDVGCGSAPHLRVFAELGAERASLHGVDLVPERIEQGRKVAPDLDLRVADAAGLPFADASFDLVTEFTALCNITDATTLTKAAQEMRRVLRRDGSIIAFDIARAPRTAPYRAITLQDFQQLFPDLTPVVVQRLFHTRTDYIAGRAPNVSGLIETLPFPKRNLLVVLRRQDSLKQSDGR
jgi:ubiquinone/menaquinone biosynthesis C-methylase UbiE